MAYNIYDITKTKKGPKTVGQTTSQQLALQVAGQEQKAQTAPTTGATKTDMQQTTVPKVDTSYAQYFGPRPGAGTATSKPTLPTGSQYEAPQKGPVPVQTSQRPSPDKSQPLETSQYNVGVGGPAPETLAPTPPAPGSQIGEPLPIPGAPAEPPKLPPRLPGSEPEGASMQELVNEAIRKLLEGEGVDTEAEKAARREQMLADEARAIQSLRARTGLGGMGLTGATGALESQLRTEAGRARTLTEAEIERAAREEALRRAQIGIGAGQAEREMGIKEQVYGIEMDLYEMETDRDHNGDGLINGVPVGDTVGDGDPSNNPGVEEELYRGEGGLPDRDQAAEAFAEQYNVDLDTVPFGTGADFAAWNNTKVFTYDGGPGIGMIEVFQRPDGTYFKKRIG